MFQPNITISSTQNNDFSIKENNRKKITEDDVRKVLTRSAKFWKSPMYVSTFGGFYSAVLSTNIKSFVNKLNEISSKAPTFDLISFLETEIRKLAVVNFKSYSDYYSQFSSDLDTEFQKVKGDLDKEIIKTLTNKVDPIFNKFNVPNLKLTSSYKDLIKEINNHKNSIDPKLNFIQDNLKKIIDNLETNKANSYQIEGLTGFYNQPDWDKEFNRLFNNVNVGYYDTTKGDDFTNFVLNGVANDYKERLKTFINNNQKTFEYRDLVEILKNNTKQLDLLGRIDELFPGSKAIIEKIQKHTDNKEYGGFGITYSSLSENMKYINIKFYWTFGSEKHLLINETRAVKNSKSDVQKAIKEFQDDSLSAKMKINPNLDFSFRALAKATSKNTGQIYKDLVAKKTGEMTIQEFMDFTKYSGQEYIKFKQIIDNIKNLTNINNQKLNVEFKVTYQIDNLSENNLLLKLVVRDKSFTKPDINNKDQIDSVNLTKDADGKNPNLPQISIKSISEEINSLLAGTEFEIGQQDFKGYDPTNNNKLHVNYLKILPINKVVKGKFYKDLDGLMQKYKSLGISLNDIGISTLIQKDKDKPNSYSINFFVTDKSLSGYRLPSDTWGSLGIINIVSLEEQLQKLGIPALLYEYSGKQNSKFDTKNLILGTDGGSITETEINNSLKLNDQNTVLPKTPQNIIDRLKDIFKNQNSIDKNHILDFAKQPPYQIRWVTENTEGNKATGHGLIWKFNFLGIDAFDFKQTNMDSGFYNVVYEFTLATLIDKEFSKQKVRRFGNSAINVINKNPLVTEEKRRLASKAISDINNIINQYTITIDNNSTGWSKVRLKKEEEKAIQKISEISRVFADNVGSSSIIDEISEIIGRPLTSKETDEVVKNAELFADLLDVTKDKSVIEEVLKNKELTDKLGKIVGKPIFKDALKALLKVKDNYQYAYLGVGIASGVGALAGVGAFFSSLRANRRIKKMNGKQAKIKGAKLISIITAFVTMGSMATSIVTLLWFFISKGGI